MLAELFGTDESKQNYFLALWTIITKVFESLTYKKIHNSKSFFHGQRKARVSDQILTYLNFDTTEVNIFAIEAVLSQCPRGKDLPVALTFTTISSTEFRYSTIKYELLAILCTIIHVITYLITIDSLVGDLN